MRWCGSGFPLLVLSFLASAAHGSVGGPLTVEMLGHDPATDRIYLRQSGHDESGGERDCVFYFDLRATHPERAQIAEASRERWSQDSTVMASHRRERQQLEKFLARLRPLARTDEGRPAFVQGAVLSDTVIAGEGYPTPRFQVEVTNLRVGVSDPVQLHVTAYFQSAISCIRSYRIPGDRGQIAILSFIGDPYEGGHETQRAVLANGGHTGPQRLEGGHGVLR